MTRQKLPETEEQERIRIGATLRELREARHVSLDELARAVDISRPYLSRIELGQKPITPEVLGKVAHVLNVRAISIVRPDYFPANLPETAAR